MNAESFESYYPNLVTNGGESPGFRTMRADGCKVNTRAVLEEAVWGFFGGGLAGAMAGCTGGTVVLPILGTATGCVGGAVFGAAAGFTSNAVKQIAKDLLRTCFR